MIPILNENKMKRFIYIALSVSLLLAGCYKPELNQLSSEIDSLKNTEIAKLSKQVEGMTSSIEKLKKLSAELKESVATVDKSCNELKEKISEVDAQLDEIKSSLQGQITESQKEVLAHLQEIKTALEGKLSDMINVLGTLEEKDIEINNKIEGLRTYADETFASKTWLEGTFATVELQNAIISDLETVKEQIKELENATETLRSEMKALIDTGLGYAVLELGDDLQNKIKNLTEQCLEAIDSTVDSLYGAFEKLLTESIATCEESVMSWVNSKLDDYYTIAEAEAKVAAFNALVGNVPAGQNLQGQINNLDAAIKDAKTRIEKLYKEAIAEAIQTSEGKLSEMMVEKISKLRQDTIAPIEASVTKLETEVANLWKELGEHEGNIKKLEDQIAAIESSLAILDKLDMTLKEYIESIQKTLQEADVENYNAVKKIIDELTALASGKDAGSLQSQITALKAYIGKLPEGQTSVAAWVSNSNKAIQESFKLYYTLEKINDFKTNLETAIGKHSTALSEMSSTISTFISDSEEDIQSWITDCLKPYYTSAEQKAKLDELELKLKGLFADGDKALQDQIDKLQSALTKAQEDLIKACQDEIDDAITKMNGVITDELDFKLSTIAGNITGLATEVEAIEEKLQTLKDNINALSIDKDNLRDAVDALLAFIKDSGYDSLKDIVEEIEAKIDELPDLYGSLADFNEMYEAVMGKDGKGGSGSIKYEVDKMEELVEDLASAEATLEVISAFVAEGYDADTLKEILDDINECLAALRTTVIDGDLRTRLDNILVLLYGKGTSPADASPESLFGKLEIVSNSFLDLSSKFRSIAYIPSYSDGKVPLRYNESNDTYTAELDFLVRPVEIATVLATSGGCTMKYIATPTKSMSFNEFKTPAEFRVTDEEEGILTANVTVTADEKQIFVDGASTALVVDTQKYDFISDFIPLYIDKAEGDYYITPNAYTIGGLGGQFIVTVYPEYSYVFPNVIWTIDSSSDWISCSSIQDRKFYTITVGPNIPAGQQRLGEVVFRCRTINILGEDVDIKLTLKVTQKAREAQNITSVSPESLSFTFDGYRIEGGEATSQKYADVSVVTNDELTDWTVSAGEYDWITPEKEAAYDFAKVSVGISKSKSARTGVVVFQTLSGDTKEVAVTQTARPVQTLSFNPSAETGLSFEYNETGSYSTYTGRWSGTYKSITVTPSDGIDDWTYEGASSEDFTIVKTGKTLDVAPKKENTSSDAKTCVLTIKSGDESQTEYTYTVTQAGCPDQTFTFAKYSNAYNDYVYIGEADSLIHVKKNGRTNSDIRVKVTGSPSNDWTVTYPQGSWITASGSGVSGSSSKYIQFRAEKNNGFERSATLTFKVNGKEYTYPVYQDSRDPYTFQDLVAPDPYSFVAQTPSITVNTSDSSTDWKVKVLDMDDKEVTDPDFWLKATTTDDSNKASLTLTSNSGDEQRQAKLLFYTFEGEEASSAKKIIITQNAPEAILLAFAETEWAAGCMPDSKDVTVVSTVPAYSDWDIEVTGDDTSWLTADKNANGGITLSAAKNTGSSARTATVSFKSGPSYVTATNTITVTQSAYVSLKFEKTSLTWKSDNIKPETVSVICNVDGFNDWDVQLNNTKDFNVSKNADGTVTINPKDKNTSSSDKTATISFVSSTKYEALGDPVSCTQSKGQTCLAAGTKITMADGSLKNVENIVEGDLVRTFDHITGEISSSKICLAWKSKDQATPLTLTFSSGKSLSIVGNHDLLSENTRKYVRINSSNVSTFVGKRFYNAESGVWDTLTGYKMETAAVDYYCLYSADHLNCIAEGMLTVPDDVDFFLNIYELDSKLKADAKQLAADIEQYGLMDVATDYPDYIQVKEIADALLCKYLYIALGKGYVTEEEIETFINTTVADWGDHL